MIKCPACGNEITKEIDGTDCHSCGESLVVFWKTLENAQAAMAANEQRQTVISEMQECINNLEKAFQELLPGKMDGSMKIYFEKVAFENSPAKFAEYAENDEFKSLYAKLSDKYQFYTNLLNSKLKSKKIMKISIAAAIVVVVLVAGISLISIFNRKDTAITVQGGEQNVAVNVNNDINVDVTTDGKRSKYQCYIFESEDHAVKYFLQADTWEEKLKCCNYPDDTVNLLNSVKRNTGDKFFKYNKIEKKERLNETQMIYTVTGSGMPKLKLVVNNEDYGYRIELHQSLIPGLSITKTKFEMEKSEKPVEGIFLCKFTESIPYTFASSAPLEEMKPIALNDSKRRYKYNKDDYHLVRSYNLNSAYQQVGFQFCVKKDSKAGKKLYEILSDGEYHPVCIDVAWDNDNYYDQVEYAKDAEGHYLHDKNMYNIYAVQRYSNEPEKIITDVKDYISFGYVSSKKELRELEQNCVPAPKL